MNELEPEMETDRNGGKGSKKGNRTVKKTKMNPYYW